MKRPVFLVATLAIALLAVTSLVMAQPYTPSVPNLINFQGRLTDNVGNPVADGAHSVHFYIFPVRTGGVSIWDELQNPTTTGGLFTTQLGLVNLLPMTLFQDYDSLFLELVADGQTIAPRTLLTSTPSTRVANALEVQHPFTPGVATVEAPAPGSACQISTYGSDGQERIRLWGCAWGELWLHDFAPSNNVTAELTANFSSGGELLLNNTGGVNQIDLNAGAGGDASAILPTDAIDSREILDEPGVSNSEPAFITLGTGAATVYLVDSVDITTPASGYVEVTCDGYMNLGHTTGTNSSYFTIISKVQGDGGIYPGVAVARVPAVIASSSPWAFTMSSSRFFVEGAPGTYRYYLMIKHETGTNLTSQFWYTSLRAKYFPTLYGTTTLANSAVGANSVAFSASSSSLTPVSAPEVTTVTVADQNGRLQAEYAKQIADLEARLKALESKQNAAQQGSPR